jgi:hypothetical protein
MNIAAWLLAACVVVGVPITWGARSSRIRAAGGGAHALRRYYLQGIAVTWLLAGALALLVMLSPELSAGGLGLRLLDPAAPNDALLALAALYLVALAAGYLRFRARLRRGQPVPGIEASRIFAPPGATERWLGLGAAISTGILMEVLYRGFLVALLSSAGVSVVAIVALVAVAEAVPRGRDEGWQQQALRALWAASQVLLVFSTGSLLLPIGARVAAGVRSSLLIWHVEPRAATQPEPEPESTPA